VQAHWSAIASILYHVPHGATHAWTATSIKPHTTVWQNHLKNEGFVAQDQTGGFSAKREYTNTTHKHKNNIMKLVITHCFHVLELQEMKLQRKTSKDISEFKRKRTFLRKHTTRCHKSNHLTLEMKTFFCTLHQRQSSARISALKAWTSYWLPPMAMPGERENLHTTLKQKAQSLRDYG
jgi:hypothetical protein